VNSSPQIDGYQFDQRLLRHPLAEIWRGRSFTGMEIVALVLTEAGSADPQVRDRLDRASRSAALEPGKQETPLWAANLNCDRPYAITQLVPGQSGAERLIDPLDGLLGNDEESLAAVRSQLSQYGAAPVPRADLPSYASQATPSTSGNPTVQGNPPASPAAANPPVQAGGGPAVQGSTSKVAVAREYRRRLGRWTYAVVVIGVLIVFSVTYSVGAAIGSAVKDKPAQTQGPAGPAVSPGPLPSPGLLPGILKASTPAYIPGGQSAPLIGATYQGAADVQVVDNIDLPFAFGWPRPPMIKKLGESTSVIYRQVLAVDSADTPTLDARIAVHPCRDLAGCLADRAAFDKQWTKAFKAPAPTTAKDGQTWLTVRNSSPYGLMMTRAFSSGGRWWLVGVAVTGVPGEEPAAQRVLNDIRRQTP
jgi:hypothetical protein